MCDALPMSHPTMPRESLHERTVARFLQAATAPDARDDVGLQGVLRAFFPVTTLDGLASLEFIGYSLEPTRYDEHACRRLRYSYAAPVKVTIRLVIWEQPGDASTRQIRDIKEQEIYFGEVPLWTARGTWLVDGVERVPLLRLTRAPGAYHVTAPGHAPGVAITPRHGSPLTLWIDRGGALQVALDDTRSVPGDAFLRAFGMDPSTLAACDPAYDVACSERTVRAYVDGATFDLGPVGRANLRRSLGHDAAAMGHGLDPRDLRAVVEVLRAERLLDEPAHTHQLLAAGDHYEAHARVGLAATLDRTRRVIDRAVELDALDTMMPHDLIHAKPLGRAWRAMIEKSLYVAPVRDRNPLAQVAQSFTVRVDDDAADAGPFTRWMTRDVDDLAALSPDAPVSELGTLDEGDADTRSLAARVAGDGAAMAVRAVPLEAPDAMPVDDPWSRAVVARSGASVVAAHAGEVLCANERRVWVGDVATGALTMHALRLRGTPQRETPFTPRVTVREGARVAAGDTLAEGICTRDGALALGRRCAVTRDASLAPGRCRVTSAAGRALRTASLVSVVDFVRDTKFGKEFLAQHAPGVDARALRHLDASGLAALDAEVDAGDALAGRVRPTEQGDVADCVLAPVSGTVVGVRVVERRGVERSPRHEAIVEALVADFDDEREEHARCLAMVRGASVESCRDELAWRDDAARWALQRGHDMPPGVVASVAFDLRVSRDLAVGDVLTEPTGRCWTVDAIDDSGDIAVTVPDELASGSVYAMVLGPALSPPPAKKRPKKPVAKRATKPAAKRRPATKRG